MRLEPEVHQIRRHGHHDYPGSNQPVQYQRDIVNGMERFAAITPARRRESGCRLQTAIDAKIERIDVASPGPRYYQTKTTFLY
jgi:hypothetical protein